MRMGLGPVGWHSLRHSYRTWLEETGVPISVQTMDGYGRGVASANRAANSRVVGMLLAEQGAEKRTQQTVTDCDAHLSD
jgi:integrase